MTVQGGGGGQSKGKGVKIQAHQGLGRRGGVAFKVRFLGSLDFFFLLYFVIQIKKLIPKTIKGKNRRLGDSQEKTVVPL